MQYTTRKDVPSQYIIDVKQYKNLALEAGKNRVADAEKRKAPQKGTFQARCPYSEAKSILSEIAVAVFCDVDPNELTLFVPRVWNGKTWVLPAEAQKPDVGRAEVRRVTHFSDALATYGKDYIDHAWIVQTLVELDDNARCTGRVYLLGWNDARADWHTAERRIPTVAFRQKRYPVFKKDVRRSMDTFDKAGVLG